MDQHQPQRGTPPGTRTLTIRFADFSRKDGRLPSPGRRPSAWFPDSDAHGRFSTVQGMFLCVHVVPPARRKIAPVG